MLKPKQYPNFCFGLLWLRAFKKWFDSSALTVSGIRFMLFWIIFTPNGKDPWNNWLPVFLSDTSLAKESIAGNSIPFTRRTLLVVLNSAVRYPKPNIWRWWQRFGGILGSLYAYKGSWVNKIKSEKHNIPFGSQKGIVMGWVGPKYCDNPRLTNKSEVMSFDGWDPSHGNQLWKMGAAGLFLMKHGQSGRSDHYGSNHHLVCQFWRCPQKWCFMKNPWFPNLFS